MGQPRHMPRLLLLLTVCGYAAGNFHRAIAAEEPPVAREYQIKAAFLHKFLNFIEWEKPPETKVICVYGQNPFGDTLERIIAVNDPLFTRASVRRTDDLAELNECQVVYIPRAETGRMADILASLGGEVVTVSDIDAFWKAGGIIQFILENGHVRFMINQQLAKDKGIRISSKLLSLARDREGE